MNKFSSIVIIVIVQICSINPVIANEVDAKKCSNSVSGGVIFRDAMSGDDEAQYYLGNKLFSPACTSDEQEKGLLFLMHAAESDHPGALFVLGHMLFENAQNDREVYDALTHLEKSSRLGYRLAQSYLGSILLNNASTQIEKFKALDLLKKAALAGSRDAANTLHHIYFSGLYEEKKSSCLANFWFALAIKKDNFTSSQIDVKIPNCSNGDKITVLE